MGQHREGVQVAARRMIRRFGAGAVEQVDLRIRELEDSGEHEAAALWRDIRAAVKALLGGGKDGKPH